MTPDEKALLLEVARWVVEQEDKIAEKLETTSPWSAELRRLIEAVRPNS
jgi:hypothetical protein